MTARVLDILDTLNIWAPFHLAETWDNVGLLVGDPARMVTNVLVGLDATTALLDEALVLGANTVITHHPVIFKPLPAIHTATPTGRLLEKALSEKITIISCHTNFDSASAGVSAVFADLLGLVDHSPLVPAATGGTAGLGLGRIGSFRDSLTFTEFMKKTLDLLQLETVMVAGQPPATINKVAICGGSGSDLAATARQLGADIYLSAEIKHSTALWAVESDFCIVDGTHYATEKPAVARLVHFLRRANAEKQWQINIFATKVERPPFVAYTKPYPPAKAE